MDHREESSSSDCRVRFWLVWIGSGDRVAGFTCFYGPVKRPRRMFERAQWKSVVAPPVVNTVGVVTHPAICGSRRRRPKMFPGKEAPR